MRNCSPRRPLRRSAATLDRCAAWLDDHRIQVHHISTYWTTRVLQRVTMHSARPSSSCILWAYVCKFDTLLPWPHSTKQCTQVECAPWGQGGLTVEWQENRGASLMSSWRRAAVVGVVAVVALATLVLAPATAAEAATVRPGAQNYQIDVLLDGYETKAAATSFWSATVICWQLGLPFWAMMAGPCQGMVSVCAAQAYYRHKWAGMTIHPGGFWCWKY
jgi:hypothetical protein